MEIKEGDIIKYIFPNPVNNDQKFFIGVVVTINDNHIFIMNDKKVRLKVSYKNYNNLEPIERQNLSVNFTGQ